MPFGGQIPGFPRWTMAEIFSQTVSVTVTNTVTERTLLGSGVGSLTLPSGELSAGSSIRLKALGIITCGASGNLTFRLKLNGTTYVAAVCAIVGIPTPVGISMDFLLTVRTKGAAGTSIGNAAVAVASSAGGLSLGSNVQAEVGIDTTAAQTIGFTAQWQNSDVLNTVTLTNLVVEELR